MEPLSKPSSIIYPQTIHTTLREFNDTSFQTKQKATAKGP